MTGILSSLSAYDYLYAAVAAFAITFILIKLKGFVRVLTNSDPVSVNFKEVEMNSVMSKCADIFPIETVQFRGNIFRRGSKVRIVTKQKKIMEGKLVGKNDMEILCIITSNHVIAHEIDKILEMVSLEPKEKL